MSSTITKNTAQSSRIFSRRIFSSPNKIDSYSLKMIKKPRSWTFSKIWLTNHGKIATIEAKANYTISLIYSMSMKAVLQR
jgi:hypothetical protein